MRHDLVTADWQPPSEELERFCGCVVDGLIAEIGEVRLRTLELTGGLAVPGPRNEWPPPEDVGTLMAVMDGCVIEFKVPPPSWPEPVRVIQMKSCLDTRQDLVTVDWQPPSDEFERFCACFADGLIAEIGEPRLRTLDLTRGPMTESEEGIVMGTIDGCLIEFKVPPPW